MNTAKQAVLLTLDYFTLSFSLKMLCKRDADLKKLCLCLPFVKRYIMKIHYPVCKIA